MFPSQYLKYTSDHFPTGSRVICSPAPTDTDEDWAVLLSGTAKDNQTFLDQLKKDGWKHEGDDRYPDTNFFSWRKGELNLILFTSAYEYSQYRHSTHIATALNLLEKEDRITLFTMMRNRPSTF